MAVTVGDKILITLNGRMFGQRLINTFHYRVNSVTGVISDITAQDEFRTALQGGANLVPKFLACCTPEYDLESVWSQWIAPFRLAKRQTTLTGALGTYDGTSQTANVAAVITRRGIFANRRNVGSLHVPIGTDDNSIADGELIPGLKTALTTLAAEMLDVNVTATGSINWQPILSNQPTADPDAFASLTETFVQDTVRVMRRRTVGLGI